MVESKNKKKTIRQNLNWFNPDRTRIEPQEQKGHEWVYSSGHTAFYYIFRRIRSL